MIKEKETYGIIVLDGSGATFATLRGRHLEIIKSITSGIAGKHRAGGQSARRFERLREVEVNEFYKRISNYATQIFLNIPDLKGLIIGGPGPTKEDFINGKYLHYTLRDKVLSVVDTAYVDEQGVKEVTAKAPEILRGVRYVEERNLVQQFLYELGHDTGLATYGEEEVRRSLLEGSVKTLLLSEGLDVVRIEVKCSNCGHSEQLTKKYIDLLKYESDLVEKLCPKCGQSTLTITKKKDLIDEFAEIAEKVDTKVELVSVAHEEGEMLRQSFGGVAAILRYKK
jgi:peptide chain release factor subunit 1